MRKVSVAAKSLHSTSDDRDNLLTQIAIACILQLDYVSSSSSSNSKQDRVQRPPTHTVIFNAPPCLHKINRSPKERVGTDGQPWKIASDNISRPAPQNIVQALPLQKPSFSLTADDRKINHNTLFLSSPFAAVPYYASFAPVLSFLHKPSSPQITPKHIKDVVARYCCPPEPHLDGRSLKANICLYQLMLTPGTERSPPRNHAPSIPPDHCCSIIDKMLTDVS